MTRGRPASGSYGGDLFDGNTTPPGVADGFSIHKPGIGANGVGKRLRVFRISEINLYGRVGKSVTQLVMVPP